MDDSAAQRTAAQLEELVEDTSALSATLKRRIKALEAQGGSGRDGQIRKQQVSVYSLHLPLRALIMCILSDCVDQVQIRRSYSKLSVGRATVSPTLQTTHGATVQDWYD
jgi:hypothetical protein